MRGISLTTARHKGSALVQSLMPPDRTSTIPTGWTDQELARQVVLANPLANRVFFDRYKDLIYSVLTRSCRIPQDHLHDAFNHVFAKLFEDGCRRLRLFRGESKLSTYLSTVTRRIGWTTGADTSPSPSPRFGISMTTTTRMTTPRPRSALSSGTLSATRRKPSRRSSALPSDHHDEVLEGDGICPSRAPAEHLDEQPVRAAHRCMEVLRVLMKRRFPDLFDAFQSFVPQV